MEWKSLLHSTLENQYGVADKLFELVDDNDLNWRPATGDNWMTTGQLLFHITEACGANVRGFVTNDWGLPEGLELSQIPMDEMMPTAEKMKSVSSVAEAKKLLAADKQVAFEMVDSCAEERLAREIVHAPWDKIDMILGQRLLEMALHLHQHKGQLFYYLKLQGKPVNTSHLW